MALSFEYKLLKWGYDKNNGPASWEEWYPVAKNGKRQSPIDLASSIVKEDPNLPPIRPSFQPCNQLNLENTGKSWQLHFHDPDMSSLTGGPLHGEYKVVQMHAHWGDKSGVGSEHTVDGTPYDAELHIVHFNTKYPSPGEAFDQEDGLAVLGIFINIGKEHPEFEKLCKRFQDIQHPFDVAQLEEEVLPTNFLPNNKSYFTYPGSLTTPPLHESVTWVVFKEHIEMSEKQLDTIRSLKTGSGKKKSVLINNYRPPCDHAERIIRFHAA